MSKSGSRRIREAGVARIYRLGEEPMDDLTSATTAAERIELVAELSRRAWEMTGQPWPSLPRHEWPVSIVRLR